MKTCRHHNVLGNDAEVDSDMLAIQSVGLLLMARS